MSLESDPDECPLCHKKGVQNRMQAVKKYNSLEVVYKRPNADCQSLFIGYFDILDGTSICLLDKTDPTIVEAQSFSDRLNKISKEFVDIYSEAHEAEQRNLKKVAGPGYRKALEFLVKDYLISKTENEDEIIKIKSDFLMSCIKKRIDDVRISDIAQRAVWLGNDETHYTRLWADKDVTDLKNLIHLVVHWIEATELTDQLVKDMS